MQMGYKENRDEYKSYFILAYKFLEWLEEQTRCHTGIRIGKYENVHFYSHDRYLGRIELRKKCELIFTSKFHSTIGKNTIDCSRHFFYLFRQVIKREQNHTNWAVVNEVDNATFIKITKDAPPSFFQALQNLLITINKKKEINNLKRINIPYVPFIQKIPEEIRDLELFPEGGATKISINKYKRSRKAREKCIRYYGTKCSVCGFDFAKTYGIIGKEYIHIHHIKPLSKIKPGYQINPIKDLRPVCLNCHAMLHQSDPPFKVEELKMYLKKVKKS